MLIIEAEGNEIYCNCVAKATNCISGIKQKGTLGILLPERDMPFTESGIVPDLIMNPHGIPSRMTHAQILECLASKYGAETGQFIDGTPFNNYDVAKLPEMLKSIGFEPYGAETM